MEQKLVLRKIREYHIIRDILKDNAVQAVARAKDPKYEKIIATFKFYVDSFGKIRIDQFEDFDRYFRRLENVYLASGKKEKVQPTDSSYIDYIKAVLGKKGIEVVSEKINEEDNIRMITEFTLDVGRAQDSNIMTVADAVLKGVKYANILMNYNEAVRAGAKKDELIKDLRNRAGISAKVEHSEKAILAEIARLEGAMLDRIALSESAATTRFDTVDAGIAGLGTRLDEIKADNKKMNSWKPYAIGGGAGLAIGALGLAGILAAGGLFAKAPVVDNTGSATVAVDTSKYYSYIDDTQAINTTLNSLIADGKMTTEELVQFLGTPENAAGSVLQNFVDKYSGTEFAEKSQGYADSMKTIANGYYGAADAKVLLNSYQVDMAGLDAELYNYLVDGIFSADEKSQYDASVDGFGAKYAATSLASIASEDVKMMKDISARISTMSENEQQALLSLAIANSTISTLESNVESLTAENADLLAYNSELAGQIETLTEKITSLEASIAELKELLNSSPDAQVQELLVKIEKLEGDLGKAVADYAELEEIVKTLQAENERLTKELQQANAELKKVQAEKAALEEDLKNNYITKAEYDAKVAELNAVEQDLRAEIADLESQVSEKDAENAKLLGQIDVLTDENEELRSQLSAANAELQRVQAEKAALEEDLKNNYITKAEYDAKVAELNAIEQGLRDEIAGLNGQIGEKDSQIADLTNQIADKDELIEYYENEIEELQTELQEVKAELKKVQDEKAALEDALKNNYITKAEYDAKVAELNAIEQGLRDEIVTLNGQIDQKDSQIDDLMLQIADKDELIEYYEGEIEELQAENAELKAQLQEANDLIDSANDTIAALQAEKAALEADLKNNYISKAEYDAKVAELQAIEQDLRSQIVELTNNIATTAEALEAKKAEYNELLERYNALGEKNAETEKKLQEAYNEIAELENALASSSSEATTLMLEIYEYLTGSTTTDISLAMQTIAEQLGITTVPPSSEAGSNIYQPGV